MNKEEVSRLKERVKADYAEKLRAIDLVEKMLAEQSPNGNVFVIPAGSSVASSLHDRVAESLQLFPKNRWTISSICTQLGGVKRSAVWKEVRRLIDEAKVREVKKGSGRTPAEYAWITSEVKS